MKYIVYSTNQKRNIFYVVIKGKKIAFFLTNKLAKTFMPILKKNLLVEFEISDKVKQIGQTKAIQVAHFNKVTSLKPFYVLYDIQKLRNDMKNVLNQFKHFLFIDFEMTMPGYNDIDFQTEIIQSGYVLTDDKGIIIKEKNMYVKPKLQQTLSKRTCKFLKIDQQRFDEEAKEYQVLYDDLREIITKYQPKLVIWGKNDMTVLNKSYLIHQKKVLTKEKDFIDLLKLHKDYYHLRNDVGLFKAYQTYYQNAFEQTHDAKDDALVTKYVYDAFVKIMALEGA